MKYSLTLFKSIFDNKTKKRLDINNWEQFTSFLFDLSEIRRSGKNDAQLFTPAIFKVNTTRSNKNVLGWAGWCAVDVDNWKVTNDFKSELISRFGDYEFICYSTASSTKEHPKFRLVFRLERYITNDEIKHFWWALNSYLGGLGDKQTKDLARMYYIPAKYDNAFNFIFINHGDSINPDSLMEQYPYDRTRDSKSFLDRLPEEFKSKVLEYRKSSLENTNYSWTSYKDCPFWPKKLGREYIMITGEGWYRQMFKIMVSIAIKAADKGYPITSNEIVDLCREFDMETGNWYENRPMDVEANNALEYAYKNVMVS
jgi:hypothetical protein